ncbi:unnamed protein product [Orchesella dallaii]|uniref:Odorant receptor n=1 Tax=Orchesella dallaii TaxID=48710 RepID=A0ABP1PLQ9_9HEXA
MNKYKSTEMINPEEICFCVILSAMLIQAVATVYTMELEPKRLVYFLRQVLNLGHITFKGFRSSERLPDFQEVIAYTIAIVIGNFPLMTGMYALLGNFDPASTLLKDIVPEIPRRLVAMVIYAIATLLGAIPCAMFLLMALTIVNILEVEAANNLKLSKGLPQKRQRKLDGFVQDVFLAMEKFFRRKNKSQIQPSIYELSHLEVIVTESILRVPEKQSQGNEMETQGNFKIVYKNHITNNLLMDTCNRNLEMYVPTMAGVGMTFCVIFNYGLLTLHNNEKWMFSLFVALFILIVINGLILFLCQHASLPLAHTTNTIRYWKGCLTRKLDKRQLRCMRPFGFKLGRFFYVKRDTALEMNDIILNVTISLLLGG